jgi:hypothetical protein
MVDVALGASGADPRRAGNRVDAHALHRRQVDDQAVVDAGKPRAIVAAAPNGDAQLVVATEIHRRYHVGDIDTASDQQRALVDHAVIKRTDIVIIGLATLDDHSAQALTQFALGFVTHDILLILWASCWRYPGHPIARNLAHGSGRRIPRSMEAAGVSAPDVVLCRRRDTAGWSDSHA